MKSTSNRRAVAITSEDAGDWKAVDDERLSRGLCKFRRMSHFRCILVKHKGTAKTFLLNENYTRTTWNPGVSCLKFTIHSFCHSACCQRACELSAPSLHSSGHSRLYLVSMLESYFVDIERTYAFLQTQ